MAWLRHIAPYALFALLFVAVFWWREVQRRRRKIAQAFEGRDSLGEAAFYERYFAARGIPADIVHRVRRILEKELDADLSRLKAEDDLTTNLAFFFDFDSLADVEIVMDLEDEFGVTITDPEAEQTHTIADIVDLAWRKVREKGTPHVASQDSPFSGPRNANR